MTRLFALALLLATTACTTTTTLYDWGNYSRISLLETRGSMTDQEYADALLVIITNAEATNKVPPGIYAEYGFALLELGNRAGAAEWFAKERAKWPESTVFMDRLIAVAAGDPAPLPPPTNALPPAPPTDAAPPVAPVAPIATPTAATTTPGNR
jgi:hypothetical protein